MKNTSSASSLGMRQKGTKLGMLYAWPMGVWFTVFFVAPLAIIILYSFLKKGLYGGVVHEFSLEAYRQLLNPAYGIVLIRTVWISVISTVITILIALPCGYAMAKSGKQTVFLLLVIVPFWTNSLIRIFAWMSILGNDGLLNTILMQLNITKDFVKFLYNQNAVVIVSVYMYLPYAILPIFTSVDRFDFSLLEAARDLGATKPGSMLRVLLPNIKSGIITAIIFTFIPIFGAYTVPLLVGGKDSYMIGNIIVDQVNKTRNWPLAAAFSMIITVISTLAVLWMISSVKKDASLKNGSKGEVKKI
ncbi:ABC transporter permease [Treponema sp. OMZ 840]|uniref:ABC transporter permease n=1 Tax=Treponema sp. OMZ 840 TaxID=244313 RepID=UPI003D9412FD